MTTDTASRIRDAVDAYGDHVSASVAAWSAIEAGTHRSRWASWRRRLAVFGSALGLLVGGAVPLEHALVSASHQGTRVSTVRPKPIPGGNSTPDAPLQDPAAGNGSSNDSLITTNSADNSIAVSAQGDQVSQYGQAAGDGEAPQGGPVEHRGPGSPGGGPTSRNLAQSSNQSSCELTGGEVGYDQNAFPSESPAQGSLGGLGNWPTCDYTAPDDGGYTANGKWSITITHPDGSTESFYNETDDPGPSCATVGYVRTGDRVHVELHQGQENKGQYYISVGNQYHC